MSEEIKPWTEAHCVRCGERYLATRGEPKKVGPDGLCSQCEIYARGRREGYLSGLAAARSVVDVYGSSLEARARESKGFVRMLAEERALVCWQIADEMDAAVLAAAREVVEAHGSRLEATAPESKGHAWVLTKERALACWQIVAAMDAAAESVEEERQGWLDPNGRRKEKKDEA